MHHHISILKVKNTFAASTAAAAAAGAARKELFASQPLTAPPCVASQQLRSSYVTWWRGAVCSVMVSCDGGMHWEVLTHV